MKSDRTALTAELTIKREHTAEDALQQARELSEFADAIQVTDNPYGWTQMSAMAAASILLNNNIDAIPFLTCRDRNRIALKSDLIGLRAIGVTSIILARGHEVPEYHEVQGRTVFDTSPLELVEMAEEIRQETDAGPKREFLIGTRGRIFKAGDDWTGKSLKQRASAGAQFMQSQLCFNPAALRHYMQKLVEKKITWNYSVIVSLAPLPSAEVARWIKSNLVNSLIPEPVIKRLEGAEDPKTEGVKICAELMQEFAEIPGVSGINLMTPGDPETVLAALQASGLAAPVPGGDT